MTPEEFKEMRYGLGYDKRPQLAEQIGVSVQCIEHWEKGRRPIPQYAVNLLKCLKLAQMVRERGLQPPAQG